MNATRIKKKLTKNNLLKNELEIHQKFYYIKDTHETRWELRLKKRQWNNAPQIIKIIAIRGIVHYSVHHLTAYIITWKRL